MFILRFRFFLTLSAHTSAALPPPSSLAGAPPTGSRHGCIWRPGWKEKRASRRLAGGVWAGVEAGSGGAGAGVWPCWRCGGRQERSLFKGSGCGSRRRSSSRRSGAAAAAMGNVRAAEGFLRNGACLGSWADACVLLISSGPVGLGLVVRPVLFGSGPACFGSTFKFIVLTFF